MDAAIAQMPCANHRLRCYDGSTARTEAIEYARAKPIASIWHRISAFTGRILKNRRVMLALLLLTMTIALTVTLVAPPTASAGIIEDTLNTVGDIISNPLTWLLDSLCKPAVDFFLKNTADCIESISANTILTGTFSKLLGTASVDGLPSISAVVKNVANGIIKPCANTILAFVIILQLLKIVRRFDQGGGTMPTVREVLTLLVVCSMFMFFVNNADWIMRGIFSLCQDIVTAIDGQLKVYDLKEHLKFVAEGATGAEKPDPMQSLASLILALLMWGGSAIACVVVQFSAIARAFTIYILTAFSPIPFAMLGFDETKSWGIGFLRAYITEVLGAAFIIFTVWAFPIAVMSLTSGTVNLLNWGDFARMAAAIVVLISFCGKSGELAGKIFGQG